LEKTGMSETTEIDRQKVDPHLTARIVQSYVRHHTVETSQVSDLITSVHRALGQVGQPAQPEEIRTPAVSVRQSVRHDYVVCLDCGYQAKMLRRHISAQHALSSDEYLKRWGLRSDHPLIAPAYSEQRSTMAKALGLGRKSKAEVASAAETPAVPAADPKSKAKPTPRRSTRSASKLDIPSEAAAKNTPTRSGRSRSRS
jgi:predicted transcriptional regulator